MSRRCRSSGISRYRSTWQTFTTPPLFTSAFAGASADKPFTGPPLRRGGLPHHWFRLLSLQKQGGTSWDEPRGKVAIGGRELARRGRIRRGGSRGREAQKDCL